MGCDAFRARTIARASRRSGVVQAGGPRFRAGTATRELEETACLDSEPPARLLRAICAAKPKRMRGGRREADPPLRTCQVQKTGYFFFFAAFFFVAFFFAAFFLAAMRNHLLEITA